jgi:hypothetical protein
MELWAHSWTNCGDGNVPTGYMGISSYLYNTDGWCVAYSTWTYNPHSCSGISEYSGYCDVAGTYYYCRGQSAVYNGNGYDYVYTNYTPNVYY